MHVYVYMYIYIYIYIRALKSCLSAGEGLFGITLEKTKGSLANGGIANLCRSWNVKHGLFVVSEKSDCEV